MESDIILMPLLRPGVKYTRLAALLTTAALAALLPLPSVLRELFAAAYAVGLGLEISRRVLPEEPLGWRAFFGTLLLVSGFMVIGGGTYFLIGLTLPVVIMLLLLAPALVALLPMRQARAALIPKETAAREKTWRPEQALGAAAALVLAALISNGWGMLAVSATDLSIRSPWDTVPKAFFVLFFVAAMGIFAATWGGADSRLTLPLAVALILLMTGVASAVYSVGFGFDPFIHQATEKVIFEKGSIDPKPFYYLGQYALVVMIAKMTGLGVEAVDRNLVPLAFAIPIIAAVWTLLRAFDWPPRIAVAAALLLGLLPLAPFIATTTQGLANVIALTTLLLALGAAAGATFPRGGLALLALAAAAVHPLTGIPLVIFIATLTYLTTYEPTRGAHEFGRKLVLAELIIIGSLAIPALFVINSWVSQHQVTLSRELLRAPASVLQELFATQTIPQRFMAVLDFAYGWKNIREAAILAAAAAGLWLLRGKGKAGTVFGAGFAMFFANYLVLKIAVRFPFLISYERTNFADRMFDLSLLLMAAPALYAAGTALMRLERGFPALRMGATMLAAALLTSSLYLAYPRRDLYDTSHGWSTTASDIKAVLIIEDDAAGAPYVVLANQSVSAAAIKTLGFKRYFSSRDPGKTGSFFFYPVPTGEELYKEFEEMNSSGGSAATARRVMALTGVDKVYFVVNDYWAQAVTTVATSRLHAEKNWNVDNRDFIFKYSR